MCKFHTLSQWYNDHVSLTQVPSLTLSNSAPHRPIRSFTCTHISLSLFHFLLLPLHLALPSSSLSHTPRPSLIPVCPPPLSFRLYFSSFPLLPLLSFPSSLPCLLALPSPLSLSPFYLILSLSLPISRHLSFSLSQSLSFSVSLSLSLSVSPVAPPPSVHFTDTVTNNI